MCVNKPCLQAEGFAFLFTIHDSRFTIHDSRFTIHEAFVLKWESMYTFGVE